MQRDKIAASWISVLGCGLSMLLLALFCYRAEAVLGDPDLWWHIKTGQDILSSHTVPRVDAFSYTFAGQPWIAKEWLSQVFLALAYDIGGWNGVLLLAALSAVASLALVYFAMAENLHPFLSGAIVVGLAIVLLPVVIARPHIFTFPLMVLFAINLFEAARSQAPPPWWLLGVVVLWVNLHASFTLAFVIAGAAFLEAMEISTLKNRALTMRWIIFVALCPLMALINPYGVQPFLIGLNLISGIQAMTLITEWLPFSAVTDPLVEAGLLVTILAILMARPKISIARAVFIVVALHMMLSHIRFVYVFFLSVPVLIAKATSLSHPGLSRIAWAQKPRDSVESFAAVHSKPLLLAIACATLVVFAIAITLNPQRPPPRRTIDGAFAYIREHNLQGPVFNNYNLGGPLILNGIKTYIDGRADQLFLGDFIRDFIASSDPDGQPLFARLLNDHNITWTLLPPSDTRNAFLAQMPQWQKTFSDPYAVIYERKP